MVEGGNKQREVVERSGGGEENENGPAETADSELPSSVTEDKGKLSSE